METAERLITADSAGVQERHASAHGNMTLLRPKKMATDKDVLHQIPILTISNKQQSQPHQRERTEDSIMQSSARNQVTVRGFDVWTDGTSLDMIRRSVQIDS